MTAAGTRGLVPRAARAAARAATRRVRTVTLPRAAADARWDLERAFLARCRELEAPSVLELGTLQSVPGRSTMHRDWVPHAREFLGGDIEAGPDVDVVADAHRLSAAVGQERFDVIISCSTFEHLKYPALAAHELLKALKVGGVLFVQTHQSFPLHGYPSDYFRFSREALAGLFGTTMGFEVKATNYDFPAKVLSRREPGTQDLPAFLNTTLWGQKHSRTPDEYRYELPPVPGA
jgi:SAM-dependent methyltransferase